MTELVLVICAIASALLLILLVVRISLWFSERKEIGLNKPFADSGHGNVDGYSAERDQISSGWIGD